MDNEINKKSIMLYILLSLCLSLSPIVLYYTTEFDICTPLHRTHHMRDDTNSYKHSIIYVIQEQLVY